MVDRLATGKAALVAELERALPPGTVIHEEEALRPYECDALPAYRQLPLLAVLPADVQQVQQVVQICRRHGVPVVARGAATGLSGGALPLADGVLLGLSRLNRILDIDPLARTARVQPGVRNLAISEAAAPHGLYYAPDPSSQIACTIGGNVAENSGGVHCLKYGLTVNNLLELKVVTAEGELLTIGSAALDSPGYDLLSLITGSEGMLGIVVEALVRLLPRPARAQVVFAAFDDVEKAADAVGAIIAAGIIPAGLEMMDGPAIAAAEDFVHAGYPRDAAAILLCEIDGTNEEVSEHVMRVNALLREAGATEVRTARDEQERLRFWQGRKAAFPAVGRISPDYYCMDGTVPRRRLGEVLRGIARLSQEYGLPVANIFHAGDGNLHPLILFDSNVPGELQRAEDFGAEILELSVRVGGTITGEHGVGHEKIRQMCVQFGAAELEQFHAVKTAFDPQTLLNPGKAIPQPRRCAEYRTVSEHRTQSNA
ncbi:FAD-linked oxidase C-terminal domain-containing protein [endosymbiont of unidentified scaly snail isolate Monju]|uniref:FAD-linked oxidase C-terminal domain-containing protein n=1 Tax=endosymbiont of unidentified scaly snail isolate Monju TaxID=1248727 RepID=UPI0003892AAC|nr:FAD-linked oxidase C-terminal domain-containing protein [endosymbiont of unidentified scaly snail isolate Monju]BAN68859.1 glycolate oxidase [endosymbiont of unidentified scaly snail isolate Monju]